jgi:hypothetical protein
MSQVIITNRWVFAVKRNEHGFGYNQVYGINYSETYAPDIMFETTQVAIYFALEKGWIILQYDVKTVFLHGMPKEEVCMEQPPGFETNRKGCMCRMTGLYMD